MVFIFDMLSSVRRNAPATIVAAYILTGGTAFAIGVHTVGIGITTVLIARTYGTFAVLSFTHPSWHARHVGTQYHELTSMS